ncbi:MAG TPA: FtsQ-type POTRA domain-containing protein [Alphaproteobacteria bacterium]|nr:FtsQ-type POTRA domain-containing protein [Alphaproteobacteria bacterium]
MRRRRSHIPLRGSVTQHTASVRMRARDTSRFGFLMRLSALLGGLVVIGILCVILWHKGWPQKQAENLADASLHMTQKAHFAVKDIVVEGRQQVNKESLMTALGTISGAPILSFDPNAAQARIAKLPWVASAIVERRLPDTIFIHLTERAPMARWQHDDRVIVIDSEGAELPEAKLDQFGQLPLVVGADAAGQAHALLDMLADYPAVQAKMTAAVRVSERRWDIYLQPKVVAKLPEKDMQRALSRLSDLIVDQKILERDIVTIDLRDPSKFILEEKSAPQTQNGAKTL